MYIRDILVTGSVEDVPYIDVMQCIKYNWLERTIIDGVPSTIVNAVGNLQLGLLDDVEPTPDSVPVFHDATLRTLYSDCVGVGPDETFIRTEGDFDIYHGYDGRNIEFADKLFFVYSNGCWKHTANTLDDARLWCEGKDSTPDSVSAGDAPMSLTGRISSLNTLMTRDHERMAVMVIADRTCVAFPRTYMLYKDAIAVGNMVTVSGTLRGALEQLIIETVKKTKSISETVYTVDPDDPRYVLSPHGERIHFYTSSPDAYFTAINLNQETATLRQQIIELEETLATQTWIEENEILRQQLADAKKRIAELSKVIQDAATELGDADVDDGHSDAAYRILQGYTS
jgi:hypothetical protein